MWTSYCKTCLNVLLQLYKSNKRLQFKRKKIVWIHPHTVIEIFQCFNLFTSDKSIPSGNGIFLVWDGNFADKKKTITLNCLQNMHWMPEN